MKTSTTRRRWLTAAALAASSVALSGCFTPKLYKDDAYHEDVSSFLVTEDGKKLVVLGTRYHYIFDLPDQLRPVLMSGYRKSLRTTFIGFHASGGSITGHYRILLPDDASADDRQAAARDGFTAVANGLVLEGDIHGKRYSTEGFAEQSKAGAQPFNRPYSIYLTESPSAAGMGLRILATPVTVAADGVLVLGGIVLVPVALVVIEAQGGFHLRP
ncbi:hypothetical protein ACVBGC_14965 [Burkholderia stagnalis]